MNTYLHLLGTSLTGDYWGQGHIAEQSTCPHELINQTATQQCEYTCGTKPFLPLDEGRIIHRERFDLLFAMAEKYGNGVAFDFCCSLTKPQPPAGFDSYIDYLEHLVQAEQEIQAENPIQF